MLDCGCDATCCGVCVHGLPRLHDGKRWLIPNDQLELYAPPDLKHFTKVSGKSEAERAMLSAERNAIDGGPSKWFWQVRGKLWSLETSEFTKARAMYTKHLDEEGRAKRRALDQAAAAAEVGRKLEAPSNVKIDLECARFNIAAKPLLDEICASWGFEFKPGKLDVLGGGDRQRLFQKAMRHFGLAEGAQVSRENHDLEHFDVVGALYAENRLRSLSRANLTCSEPMVINATGVAEYDARSHNIELLLDELPVYDFTLPRHLDFAALLVDGTVRRLR